MKHGFTLLEVVIVLLIGSMMFFGLYSLFFQVTRAVRSISRVIELDFPLIPFYNQLERDINGMFSPISTIKAYLQEEALKLKEKKDKKSEKVEKNEKEEQKLKESKLDSNLEEKETKITDVFYIKSDPKQFVFSFITTGGLQKLESDGTLTAQPYVRRVAYILQKNEQGISNIIYKYQSEDLDLKKIILNDFLPSYIIASNIKNLSVTLTVFEKESEELKEEKELNSDASEKTMQTKEVVKDRKPVVLTEWNEKEVFEKYKALIPAYVTIEGNFVDLNSKIEYPFIFEFKVPAYNTYEKRELEKTAQEQVQATEEKSKIILSKLNNFLNEKFKPKNNKIILSRATR